MEENFIFSGIIFKNGEDFYSHCLDLDISSKGDTLEDAKQNLIAAVSNFSKKTADERKEIVFKSLDSRSHGEGFIVEEFFFKNNINLLSKIDYNIKPDIRLQDKPAAEEGFITINKKRINKKYFTRSA